MRWAICLRSWSASEKTSQRASRPLEREDAQRCDPRTRARPGLRARDERLLPAQAARRGLGTAGARSAPAAKRRRALSLQVVRGGLAGGARSLGASRRRPCARTAVGRTGRPLRRAGLPRRARRAVLRLPPRSAAVDRLGHHGGGARDHRDYPRGATQRASGLRTGRLDHHRVRRPPGRHGSCRDGWPPPRPPGEGGPAPRCSRRRAVRHLGHRAQVPHPCRSRRGARADQPMDCARRWPPR